MEALKLKIFEVLTEKIPVTDFEKWLYNTDEFIKKLDSNTFYFEVITINYKNENCLSQLSQLATKTYKEDYNEILNIQKKCLEISNSETPQQVYKTIGEIGNNFDYDTDYDILWQLYSIYEYFESYYGGKQDKIELLKEAKFYTKQTLLILDKCITIDDTKKALQIDLAPYTTSDSKQKPSLKQKIFAFFKKI